MKKLRFSIYRFVYIISYKVFPPKFVFWKKNSSIDGLLWKCLPELVIILIKYL